MTEVKRVNTDWLRVKLMCLVIVLHYLHVNDALPVAGSAYEPVRIFGMFLESFAIVAVNVWVILSGYLRVHSGFNPSRFLELLLTVVFYGITITVAAHLTGFAPARNGVFGMVQALFPVSNGSYWFMTTYLLLYPVSAFLNAGAKALSKEQFRLILFVMILFGSLIKSCVPVNFPPDDMGYGLQWFIFLYLCGAYMRLHLPVTEYRTDIKMLCGYALSACAVFALTCALYAIHARTGQFAWFSGVPFHYNFILNLVSAVCFFRWFYSLRMPKGRFAEAGAFLAPLVTGVYLLHAHPVLFERWGELTAHLTGRAPRGNLPLFFLHLVVTVVIVFVCGIVCDSVRRRLFRIVRIGTPAGKKS